VYLIVNKVLSLLLFKMRRGLRIHLLLVQSHGTGQEDELKKVGEEESVANFSCRDCM